MFEYIRKNIHAKILVLIIGFISIGVVVSIYWELTSYKKDLLEEKLRASRFMARPVLNAIYVDMLDERADLARKLLKTLGSIKGVELKIIRSNGVEEAFRDMKTIRAVEREFGEVRPEWLADRNDEEENRAMETATENFKRALEAFQADWRRPPVYYTETRGGRTYFTYLKPIEKRPKCNTCHSGNAARGILMISTPLDDMYLLLATKREYWIISGVLAVFFGGVVLSIFIKRTVTGPLKKNVALIKRIAEAEADVSERITVSSEDEVGYLARAFNDMLDSLQKREEENRKLFSMVEKGKKEWMVTFDSIQDLISIHDRDDRVVRVNTALARKFGVEPKDLINRTCAELFWGGEPGHVRCPHAMTIGTGRAATIEASDLAIEGTYRITTYPVRGDGGEVTAVVHVARDVTVERLLREQLLHAEKLSSMGKLVAGIAHELNNPLMGIMGFSQILKDTSDERPVGEIKDKLEKIFHESMRTARIVQNLLTFARSSRTERSYSDINEILRHTVELREYSLKANNVDLRLDLDPGLPATMVDKYQMQQVFINIINNAEDAMVEANRGGTLVICTRKKGGSIEINFIDNGPGVPDEIKHRVFDPFFTTKEVGRGTGLGLSITHGIVTEHGGTITIGRDRGGGTAVTIILPVVERDVWDEVQKAFDPNGLTEETPPGHRVLVVDDEASIRESLSALLTQRGFMVDCVSDGREAVESLARGDYSLVITDIKMPGMGGVELYREIEKKHPHLKGRVIMLTGDVFSDSTRQFLSEKKCPYFLKPVEPGKLLAEITRLLVS